MTTPVDNRGLLDTSTFIAEEVGRPLSELPQVSAISVVTIAELSLGVLMAQGQIVRARRLRTLTSVQNSYDPIPIDPSVAQAFAEIVVEARRAGRRPKIMDTWIAATAFAHDLPVYTQDEDFTLIPRIRVRRV